MTLEAMGSNEAALAFLLLRTIARGFEAVYQVPIVGGVGLSPATSSELSAQVAAMLVAMKAGYDHLAGTDCLARILYLHKAQAPVDAELVNAFALPDGTALLIQSLGTFATGSCPRVASIGLDTVCAAAHELWHPHFPANVP
jgi:hypothetical protein